MSIVEPETPPSGRHQLIKFLHSKFAFVTDDTSTSELIRQARAARDLGRRQFQGHRQLCQSGAAATATVRSLEAQARGQFPRRSPR
jgi:hypothetical protein